MSNNDNNKQDIFELFYEVYKLGNVKKSIGDADPKEVEKVYFEKFGCHTEKEKITLEAKYIKTKLFSKLNNEQNKEKEAIQNSIKLIDFIIDNIDDFRQKDIAKVRRSLVVIELKYNLKIGLVSDVDYLYADRVNRLNEYNDSVKKIFKKTFDESGLPKPSTLTLEKNDESSDEDFPRRSK